MISANNLTSPPDQNRAPDQLGTEKVLVGSRLKKERKKERETDRAERETERQIEQRERQRERERESRTFLKTSMLGESFSPPQLVLVWAMADGSHHQDPEEVSRSPTGDSGLRVSLLPARPHNKYISNAP